MGTVTYPGESNWPLFDNRLVPGATATMHASLRFALPGADVSTIANDVRHVYAATYPFEVTWSDRRTIATVFLAASQPQNLTPTNPNMWLDDPTIDTSTPAGLDAFYSKMLAYGDRIVANLLANNAQGVMFWDLEGAANSNINYIGDPRMISTFAPEMEYHGLIDTFLKKFTDAGLRVGMMLRAQQLQLINGVWEQHGVPRPRPAPPRQDDLRPQPLGRLHVLHRLQRRLRRPPHQAGPRSHARRPDHP